VVSPGAAGVVLEVVPSAFGGASGPNGVGCLSHVVVEAAASRAFGLRVGGVSRGDRVWGVRQLVVRMVAAGTPDRFGRLGEVVLGAVVPVALEPRVGGAPAADRFGFGVVDGTPRAEVFVVSSKVVEATTARARRFRIGVAASGWFGLGVVAWVAGVGDVLVGVAEAVVTRVGGVVPGRFEVVGEPGPRCLMAWAIDVCGGVGWGVGAAAVARWFGGQVAGVPGWDVREVAAGVGRSVGSVPGVGRVRVLLLVRRECRGGRVSW